MSYLIQITEVIGEVPEVENLQNDMSRFFQKISVGTILSVADADADGDGYVNILNKNRDDLELFSSEVFAKMMLSYFKYRRIK